MKKVLFLVNHDVVIYNFRRELVERLIEEGDEVIISSPYGERIELLKEMGCKYIEVKFDRHGKNPLAELKLLTYYKKLISTVKPDMIFSYTIKPNLYGAIAASKCNIPIVVNITGLGTAVEYPSLMQKCMIELYKYAFRNVQTVFVQNEENRQFFIDNNIAVDKLKLLPGSGVNLKYFHILEYPNDEQIRFVFISRIMKEKGIDQYLAAAKYIKNKYPFTKFYICGFCEEEYGDILKEYEKKGIITYQGLVMNIRDVLKYTHCTIHPTYYPEGLSNVLLESCASGRPIITTDRSGCKEVVVDGLNGFIVKERDEKDLISKIETFLKLDYISKRTLGLNGRNKVEKEFDRKIVINKYMEEINGL